MASHSALLVVDVQRGLFVRSAPIYQADRLLANICLLIERARAVGALVCFIQHTNNQLPQASEAWQLHASLEPQPGDLRLAKQHSSSFLGTSLQDDLLAHGITDVVVCGLVSHGCVKAACLDAARLGFHVTLASDAHSNWNRQAPALIATVQDEVAGAGVRVAVSTAIRFSEV